MCGIIGILGSKEVAPQIIAGLKRLEYRGYDSAGIATLHDGRLARRRAPGKLSNLDEALSATPLPGIAGIGHTRWATHGAPNETNAHPHMTERVAVVHNGIIENFAELRRELEDKGIVFESETDAEVCPQLITYYLQTENMAPVEAFKKAIGRMRGAFAFAAIFSGEDDLMICGRKGSPLAIGRGNDEMYLGSDAYALAPFTNRVTYLEEGDWAVLTRNSIDVRDEAGAKVQRQEVISSASQGLVDKEGHRHFMAKEIHEQPEVIAHTISRYVDPSTKTVRLPNGVFDFAKLDRLTVTACGTAYYAGLVSKYWFEKWAKLPIEIDVASELRYRDVPWTKNGGALFISQSGETADTLAALRDARANGQQIATVVNVAESSIAREADIIFPMAAGPEIGVASTKAFTCQLVSLACIAIAAGRIRGTLTAEEESVLVTSLLEIPRLVSEALKQSDKIETIARDIAKATGIFYIGRGVSYPIALEGALKLKEISYIHAEGYAAGELKHGPIALIDENLPIVVIAPKDAHFEKTVSNMQEVMARDGKALMVSCKDGIAEAGGKTWAAIETPQTHPMLAPIVYTVPVQLLAYFTATTKGTDVDQPRNLAKSVTVE
ncbi:glutamine--fructose-6-phosphate transaminase (isomerizing) [Hyphococcus flavus]|uniref:Glutamine--fructose-6-phosphate aminotransferase [isomerizing] n=1 Tax=Hyphococcus flavus TaxID=1866326 RepID=A0AAE9ZD58_9PROT|nr:glutamine--fructose-6-phosphate transaminase (isomerizing) [Hyphococcus flavus]WDI30453.1 glutamine--fructose-6-phosphate transaminase (isomerizing) [Hyphococcus flavus]